MKKQTLNSVLKVKFISTHRSKEPTMIYILLLGLYISAANLESIQDHDSYEKLPYSPSNYSTHRKFFDFLHRKLRIQSIFRKNVDYVKMPGDCMK